MGQQGYLLEHLQIRRWNSNSPPTGNLRSCISDALGASPLKPCSSRAVTTSISGGHLSATCSRKIETDGVTETKGDFIQDYYNRSQSGCIKRETMDYISVRRQERF